MASKPPEVTRHRIQEIKLRPAISASYAISLKILVDDQQKHRTTKVAAGRPLQWDSIPPFDIQPTSQIKIRVYEHHLFNTRKCVGTAEYSVPITDGPLEMSKDCVPPGWSVAVVFPTPQPVGDIAAQVLSEAQAMERQKRLLEKLGPARGAIDTILKFGGVVADLDPRAKGAFALFSQAWEVLAAQEKCDDIVKTLLNGLADILPSVESVKHAAKLPQLQEAIGKLWNLIEDASLLVKEYKSTGEAILILKHVVGSSAQEQIDKTISTLKELKETFDRSIGIQILQEVDKSIKQTLLDKIMLGDKAAYDASRACTPGTREGIIQKILGWAKETDSFGPTGPKNFLWLHGQAGLGKSAIASSICSDLHANQLLATGFFCKRDQEECRQPRRVLSSVIYGLAAHHPAYASAVRKVLDEDPMVHGSQMTTLFNKLVLPILGSPSFASSDTRHVIVVDALDECDKKDNQHSDLLKHLLHASKLVPWLKIIVTSRPDSDIKELFDQDKDKSSFTIHNLYEHDASNDILVFIKEQLSQPTKAAGYLKSDAPELLAKGAAGLFIWARTACEFVLKSYDPPGALKNILDRTRSGKSSQRLNELYTMALEASISNRDDRESARDAVRECLGATILCSSRTPLSIVALSKLFGKRISEQVLDLVVKSLSSVLYIDHSLGDAVRVYHASFADYMLIRERSGEFCVDIKEQNSYLAGRCLNIMMGELRFNICGLETSYKRNREIVDLTSRIDRTVAHHLRYICTYWASHLIDIQDNQAANACQDLLHMFLSGQFVLYWIEVLSLLAKLDVGVKSIQSLQEYYQRQGSAPLKSLKEIGRFLQAFYHPVQESAPHLYVSAMAFLPSRSSMNQNRELCYPSTVMIASGVRQGWARWTQSIAHEYAVNAVAVSPKGNWIISGSADGKMRKWDAATGAPVGEPLAGHSRGVTSVAFSSDGRHIVSGSWDKTVRVWNAATGAPVGEPLAGHSDRVTSVAFSSDGRHIVSGSADNTVRVWDAATDAPVGEPLAGHSDWVTSVAFSSDGRHIVSGSADKTVRVWGAATRAPVGEPLAGHSDRVTSVAFSSDGRHIVSGSYDNTVRVWNAATGAPVGEPLAGHSQWVTSVAFSSDGRHIVSGSYDNTVRVWDAATGAPVGEPLAGHSHGVTSVAFLSDGRHIVSGSYDKTVRVWDAATGAPVGEPLAGHSDRVTSVAFSSDARHIVSGSTDKTVRVWNAATGAPVGEPLAGHSDWVTSVAFSSDGRHIVSGSYDNTVRVWGAVTGAPVDEPLAGHSDRVTSVAFSSDGCHIVSGSYDNTVRVWNAATGAPVGEPLAGHSRGVTSVAFSSDGCHIVSGSYDNTVRVWDAATGAPVGEPLAGHSDGVTSVAFSSDGRHIVSGSWDKTVRVWDAATGAPVGEPLADHSDWVTSVAFSSDGRHIVSGSADNRVRVWDAATGAPVGEPLAGHSRGVTSVAFSSDGRHIVSGSADKTVRVWGADVVASMGSLSNFLGSQTTVTFPLNKLPADCNTSISKENTRKVPRPLLGFTRQNVSYLMPYFTFDGWISLASGELLFWLPSEYRQDDHSLLVIPSTQPQPAWLDFSNFRHGTDWINGVVQPKATVSP